MPKRKDNHSASTARLIADLKALAQDTESTVYKEWKKQRSVIEQRLRECLKEESGLLPERASADHSPDDTPQSDNRVAPTQKRSIKKMR